MKTGSFIYSDQPCASVHWKDEDRIVWVEWKKTPDSVSFRSTLDAGIELITQKQGQRWLADCLKMGPVAIEDTRWANEDWASRAALAGVKRLAFVMPQRVSAAISVKGFANEGGEKLNSRYFNDFEEARRWLLEPC